MDARILTVVPPVTGPLCGLMLKTCVAGCIVDRMPSSDVNTASTCGLDGSIAHLEAEVAREAQTARAVGHKVWRRTVLLPDHDEERELVRVRGRRHTRMSKCEYESRIYTGEEYNREGQGGGLVGKEAFYWRVGFDPETIRQVEVSD